MHVFFVFCSIQTNEVNSQVTSGQERSHFHLRLVIRVTKGYTATLAKAQLGSRDEGLAQRVLWAYDSLSARRVGV